LASNVPVFSLAIIWAWSAMTHTRWTLWLQDIPSGLAGVVAGDETMVTRSLRMLEYALIRRAPSIVTISGEFADEFAGAGIDPGRIVVIENWAPLGELPERPRHNEWSALHGLDDRFVFLYSGTLDKKHNPSLLRALASAFADDPTTEAVVVAECAGAEWLAEQEASALR
jgi:colanic acid biosynthesis glycosyl transferase WcaI